MQVLSANDFEFEILYEFGKKWVVDFRYHTYGCGAWQLSGLPCKHAMASLSHKRYHDGSSEPAQFVHALLKNDAYTQTYQPIIHPIHDQRTWPEIPNDKILHLIMKTKLGKPKVKRRREQGESAISKVVRCTGCRGLGHNIRGDIQTPMNKNSHLNHNISNNPNHSRIG
ncbi:hypothetical protein Dsin_010247 [Dipteronia sinensis]|uniref:Zinc finger PMZ-type domain-containing protein n=1 Tax=Dipteronia sinensis TaxID=43782 RepID=A0AAE0ECV8_9ROSI|nr:hypothetical protein Dsin_010247 [Dipteronia sinensis]